MDRHSERKSGDMCEFNGMKVEGMKSQLTGEMKQEVDSRTGIT